jgi:hypothetical protein
MRLVDRKKQQNRQDQGKPGECPSHMDRGQSSHTFMTISFG